jgi:alkaline phosphatase D
MKTRRELIAAAAATATAAAVPPAWGKRLLSSRARVGPGAFLDGVATGEPGTRAITFWSRLETERPRSGARLIVARDEDLERVVATAVVPTGRAINGTLKARIGGLKPGREYFYAWESGDDVSPIGRTRTRPPNGSSAPVRIAASSCQHYAFGFYSAHAHAASRDDLDVYLFLGDYIYERGRNDSPYRPRQDPIDCVDLRTYRSKYQLYRSDAGLRELHRLHPTMHIWDDHEVANNYTDGNPSPSPQQQIAGYRAAFEWLPRIVLPSERYRVYRKLQLGSLVDVFLLDERQYRVQGSGDTRTMLGPKQLAWLIDGLQRSTATWKVIAQQVTVAPIRETDPDSGADDWDGFPEERGRILGILEQSGIDNVVFLTGDAHVFMANLLASDFPALGDGSGRKPAATEFVGGSVTSTGLDLDEATVMAEAPWIKAYNGHDHGYATFAFDSAQLVAEYLRSDLFAPEGATVPFERFTQPLGANAFTRQPLRRQ